MDFLEGPQGDARFLLDEAESAKDWVCLRCGGTLRLVVSGLGGDAEKAKEALHVELLPPVERRSAERPRDTNGSSSF